MVVAMLEGNQMAISSLLYMIQRKMLNRLLLITSQPETKISQNFMEKQIERAGSVCKIPRIFKRVNSSNFQTQGSFIVSNSRTIFERDFLSSDSVAKSGTQKPWAFSY